MRRRLLLGPLVAAVVLAGCGTSHGATPPASTPSTARRTPASGTATSPTKVLVVIEENHSLAEMRSGMPFLARLSDRYGYATHWHALTHPSEPNYLAIAGGSTFGVTNDGAPAANASRVGSAHSVFGQARSAGKSARTYAQSMPTPCATSSRSPYAVKHNPWPYFATERAACRRHDLDTSTFAQDARANHLPAVGFLIPDLLHDAHDGTLSAADVWLHHRLRPVLRSNDFKQGRLVVVVTADEDDGHSGNVVLTSVLTPRIHHVVVKKQLSHYSLTRFIDRVLGVAPLRNAAQAPGMGKAFGL